jgi:GMP synthase-like glutamine amidotransferase
MVFSHHSVCLVLDYGSQYTQLIARRIRENGVLSILLPGDVNMVRNANNKQAHCIVQATATVAPAVHPPPPF